MLVFLQLHSDVATDCEIMAFEYKHFDRIMFLKVSEKQVWANSINTNQTAPEGLHCLPIRMHLLKSLLDGKTTVAQFLR